ncbi:Ribosome biogenesis protein-Nop58p/Nop5p [Plasmopara halstedii]|uniref:Ribosome biogenesis protein-Nop58p/Nop5p n=1 Tax=Plasmopara halstedii TaxID=4781 RepID=A0A0P1AAZ0_PLAHL|nr:Ribosome biogenesis protein-Nop58p/Nop5p [Plasmopara halstedii]CEG37473.1 Ribosome biogenesis protein-Nop58p/Nop5p [Plasmopara halstedii]|eukprot:XP_024573842.1 Ribosome biogenesis protein-Nop58p/Nop5p [Plasmopara halstedii]
MLVLFETAAGHALFKVQDEAKLASADDVYKYFATPEKATKVLKLKGFNAFKNTTEAVAAATEMVDGKMGKTLRKFLKKNVVDAGLKDKLAVSDKALGAIIKEKLSIACVNDTAVNEIMRGIRANMDTLITGLEDDDLKAMTLGLSHSLSRYKLKFSADKVDTMIVQAIGLLDELDKEINTYSMRVREWFGWHFPEMGKIVTDNLQYAKCVRKMGMRTQVKSLDFSDILSEDVEASMREVCEISMGTDISEEDVTNISALCDQVISLTEYRAQLFDYLKNRMNAIAPNLTVMVGELVGARLIAHAGSLMNLAKHPASTVQILGAEKALFRALKTKHDTPKYGLIYHASLIGQTAPKHKGKISRVLAAKTALAVRVDALGDATEATIGFDNRAKVEARVRQLENGFSGVPNSNGKTKNEAKKYVKTETSKSYNADADMTLSGKKRKAEEDGEMENEEEEPKLKKEKKEKKHKKMKAIEETAEIEIDA